MCALLSHVKAASRRHALLAIAASAASVCGCRAFLPTQNEVRRIGYGLNNFTVFFEPERVQHQSQDDRKREGYEQSIQTQDQRVLDRRSEIRG